MIRLLMTYILKKNKGTLMNPPYFLEKKRLRAHPLQNYFKYVASEVLYD